MKRFLLILFCACMLLCGCVEEIPADAPPNYTLPAESAAESEPPFTEPSSAAPAPTEPEEVRVSFLGCGDNIVYYGNVLEASETAGAYAYNFAPTYAKVAHLIAGADIAMINQETLMAGNGFDFSYYPRFNGPQDMGRTLTDTGFDVISIANNHMLDKNSAGLAATMDFWESQSVLQIGGYRDSSDYETPRILERNGIRIAFLAYTYGTNGISLEEDSKLVIPLLKEDSLRRQIAAARSNSDFVVVSVHWGEEGSFTPSEEQKTYARIMTEAGADAIIGHHPHVLQPIEWLTASDGTKTLCVYSLGNFIGEQAYDYNMVGGMISFDFVKTGENTHIDCPLLTPTVYYFRTNFRGNQVYLMEEFTEELAQNHGITHYENTTTLERLRSYVTDTVPLEFLPEGFH